MEMAIILKTLFSLGVVFAILYILLKLSQKYSKFGNSSKYYIKGNGLKIENIIYIDEGTKIVNISDKSGNNYLIAFGKNNSFLIDKYQVSEKREENE